MITRKAKRVYTFSLGLCKFRITSCTHFRERARRTYVFDILRSERATQFEVAYPRGCLYRSIYLFPPKSRERRLAIRIIAAVQRDILDTLSREARIDLLKDCREWVRRTSVIYPVRSTGGLSNVRIIDNQVTPYRHT